MTSASANANDCHWVPDQDDLDIPDDAREAMREAFETKVVALPEHLDEEQVDPRLRPRGG